MGYMGILLDYNYPKPYSIYLLGFGDVGSGISGLGTLVLRTRCRGFQVWGLLGLGSLGFRCWGLGRVWVLDLFGISGS